MCGIAGFLNGSKGPLASEWPAILARMGMSIAHRGPDDSGIWTDTNDGVGLVHRRLSILDLSPAGHQPMVSASGRFVIVFNGEIYNHLALRKTLESGDTDSRHSPGTGCKQLRWHGHSDTETLLAGFEAWGIEATLKKTVGMFALALWDRADRSLTLARDRMGEKPLFYGWQGHYFLFGSELKAVKAHPSFKGEINRDALTLLLRHNYIPAPYSIYKGIHKLPAGTWLRIDTGNGNAQNQPLGEPKEYWSLAKVAAEGLADSFTGNEAGAIEVLEEQLRGSIGLQMVADVPLGAFLSGGVDSSTVVALMQTQSSRPVRTFTIGFHEEEHNEAEYAKKVARHLGTDHTELYVTPQQAREVIPYLPALYDEPFSDSSQIPTFLVSRLARQYVTVSLSGDGGDELFGGYGRYFLARSIWDTVGRIPRVGRHALARVIQYFPHKMMNNLGQTLGALLPRRWRDRPLGDRAHKLAEILAAPNQEEIYRGLLSHWKRPTDVVINSCEPSTMFINQVEKPEMTNFECRMMFLDAMNYLPDDILVKVDRAAMGVSLETRIPMLDHRVVEFAWRLPLTMKIHRGQGKWILRQVLYKYVPKELIERPKKGFGIPIDNWLRGPMRDWAETLLDESRLRRENYFNPEPIREKWNEHISGQRNWQYYLWDILMFQAWLEAQKH